MQRRTMIFLAAALVVLVAGGGIWTAFFRARPAAQPAPPPRGFAEAPPAEVTLTPVRADATGIDPATAFQLTAEQALDVAQVQKQLQVQPAVELKVEKADLQGKTFHVKPAQPLEPARVYRFSLASVSGVTRPYRWSFQTRSQFQILGTLPRKQAAGVPVNTGIEVIFSHANYADLEPFFQITPAVPGRFERHGKTAVFVPGEPLKPGTIYTVTIREGLAQTGAEGKLTADYSFGFETMPEGNAKGQPYFFAPNEPQEFAAKDAPYLQVFSDKQGTQPEIDVQVYRYADAAAYAGALATFDAVPWWAQYARQQIRTDPTGLTPVTSFKGKSQTFAGMYAPYLIFPEPLAPGYYLAVLKVDDMERQVQFQVTDIASYYSVTGTQTLVWLNDLSSKAPVAGATVQPLGGGAAVRSDAGGVAALPSPQPAGAGEQPRGFYLLVRSADGKETVTGGAITQPWYLRGDSALDTAQLYWKYLYLDRTLYRPDDKINLWGVLSPREPGAPAIDAVTVEVLRHEYTGYDNRPVTLASTLVSVRDGTFTGSLTLPGVRPGWYTIQVHQGDHYLTSRGFEVGTYTKPAYKIDLTASKRAVFAGESVEFRLGASFFEGTPVPSLGLAYAIGWGNSSTQYVSTDATGRATIRFTPQNADLPNSEGGQSSAWFNVRANSPEAGELAAYSSVQVFTRNVTMNPVARVEGDQAIISGTLRQVSLEKLNAGTDHDYLGEPAAGQALRGTLIENNWIKEAAGETYDFITKTVQKQYNYRPAPRTVGTFTASSGPDGSFRLTLPIDKTKTYQFQLEAQDLKGDWLRRDVHFSGADSEGPDNNRRWYYLMPAVPGKYTWGLGEPVDLLFTSGDKPSADRPRGYLFYTARLGLQGWQVQDSSRYQLSLKAADLPNTNVKGVYFDGRVYREAPEYAVRFNAEERKLKVEVTPDKSSYRPGDTVNLGVRVLDPDGRPLRATVNLNLVDEALFALSDQQADLLGGLYGEHVQAGILRSHASHALPEPGGGAEKGGEGGGARKDFQDAIYFNTVSTGADGRATATFQVPDNLTAWRVTYQALVSGTMQAGGGTLGLPVKLPFFVDLILGQTYLTGDQPVATVRSFGDSLSQDQSVDFRVEVTGPDGAAPGFSLTAAAFQAGLVPLPPLKAGTYKVTVSGSAPGGLSDALEQTVTVVDTYLRQTKVDYHLLQPDLRLTGGDKGLTMLTFTDHQRGTYLQLLQRLQYDWGNRIEQRLARAVAADLLQEHFGQRFSTDPLDTTAYQTPEGGLAILPYADASLELSAFAADLTPERFDRAALTTYLEKILDDPRSGRERAVTALYGLAALNRPVLTEVQALLQATDLSRDEQLCLGLALASLGDLEGARPLYYKLLAGQGEQLGSVARIKVSDSQDEILVATARTAVLAAKLGEAQAPMLAGYLLTTGTKEVLVSLEQALVAREMLPALAGQTAAFTYSLKGQAASHELKPGESFRLAVTAADLATLSFQDIRGEVGLTATYEAPLNAAAVKPEDGFKVSRSYSAGGKGGTTWQAGDLVEVSIYYTVPESAPGGGYMVTDYLPSGLRLVQRPFQFSGKVSSGDYLAWPMEVNGQRVSFWAGKQGRPIKYYARVASPGEYTAEQPALFHNSSGIIYSLGQRERVEIQ